MNWFNEIERIAEEHRSALRRTAYRLEDLETETNARSRELSEQWYARYKADERR